MELDIGRVILLLIASFLVLMWILLATRNTSKYAEIMESIDSERFKYPDIFVVGFSIMQLLRIDLKSDKARTRIKEISEIEGRKYAEYYYYIGNGAKWSYGATIIVFFALFAALGNAPIALLFGGLLAWLGMMYVDERFKDQLEERKDQLISDFPQMLSKMTLLVNSGMTVREAWRRIAGSNDNALYREMRATILEMDNGVTEVEAYKNFADRCAIKEIRRFSASITQALQKGSKEITTLLKSMADDMWEEKKHMVKRKGEAANSKLLIPTAMIFIGILLMIIIPAFSGL